MCDNNSIVWGSGFLTYNDDLGVLHWGKTNNECRLAPKVIHAVRGPLTRNKLIAMNVDCPAVFGDPALLFPIFYQPSIKRSYKLGVIPHFLDLASPVLRTLRNDDRVKIIRVVHSRLEYLPISNRRYLRFVDDICRCEKIVSASLHGLIVADAYGIPVHWMTMSKRATLDGFKYHDYFASVNRPEGDAMVIDRDCSFQSVMRCFKAYSTRIHVEQLLESCPFRRESVERFEG
jgi:pyruvyltransferase